MTTDSAAVTAELANQCEINAAYFTRMQSELNTYTKFLLDKPAGTDESRAFIFSSFVERFEENFSRVQDNMERMQALVQQLKS